MRVARVLAVLVAVARSACFGQETDSLALEKLRRESGVDPTRVQSRAGYTFLVFDRAGPDGQIVNRASLNVAVARWNFGMKYEAITQTTEAGTGFQSSFGDIRFSVLNAFWVSGKHALAGSVEFSMPTAKPTFGVPYFSATPAITYSYTVTPSLFLAFQPQYTFALLKDPEFPDLRVLTLRMFVAKFAKTGYFFVFEPRPVYDITADRFDLIFSPIVGKALGAGFNLIGLVEIPANSFTRDTRGVLYQFGFNKNF